MINLVLLKEIKDFTKYFSNLSVNSYSLISRKKTSKKYINQSQSILITEIQPKPISEDDEYISTNAEPK